MGNTQTLFKLLDLDPNNTADRSKLDGNAVIKEVQQRPRSAEKTYNFPHYCCYPLHQAIMLGAGVDVVEALYNSHPPAIRECRGISALHLALSFSLWSPSGSDDSTKASPEVISFVLDKWPEATHEKNSEGHTPLHAACKWKAPLEVVSALLDCYPDAAKSKCIYGKVPLHYACYYDAPLEVVSLLLDHYPAGTREKSFIGIVPLHYACEYRKPLQMVLLLLDKWPEAIWQEDVRFHTPLDYSRQRGLSDVEQVLSFVSNLRNNNEVDYDSLKQMMMFFIEIKWGAGVAMVLSRDPKLMQELNIHFKVLPDFLFMVGGRCDLATIWYIISNEQDVLAGITK